MKIKKNEKFIEVTFILKSSSVIIPKEYEGGIFKKGKLDVMTDKIWDIFRKGIINVSANEFTLHERRDYERRKTHSYIEQSIARKNIPKWLRRAI